MRLKRLKVHNYRSIRDLDMECQTMVKLLGPNNHGKSNLLLALEFGLSTSAKPTEADFFAHREDEQLWVEMTFCELTDQAVPLIAAVQPEYPDWQHSPRTSRTPYSSMP
jgi:putative ATP-dependent endonuclease of OLD family